MGCFAVSILPRYCPISPCADWFVSFLLAAFSREGLPRSAAPHPAPLMAAHAHILSNVVMILVRPNRCATTCTGTPAEHLPLHAARLSRWHFPIGNGFAERGNLNGHICRCVDCYRCPTGESARGCKRRSPVQHPRPIVGRQRRRQCHRREEGFYLSEPVEAAMIEKGWS
jgi:hypothetical protein